MKRLAAYCIISLFITIILIQLFSYSPITTPQLPHEKYDREYTSLVTYSLILTTTSIILLIATWFQQYNYKRIKLLGHAEDPATISSLQYWLLYEWRFLSLITISLLDLLKIGSLVGLNVWLIFKDIDRITQENLFDDRNMYLQILANRSAQLAIVNIAMAVLLSAKLSFLQRCFFDVHQTLNWHAWFARLGFAQVLYHATYQLQFNFARQERSVWNTVTTNVRYVTGTSMLTALVILTLGSHPVVRLLSYRLFRWTHMVSFFVLIVFGCLHHWAFYIFYAVVLLFWVADQVDRSFVTESCTVESLPGDIVKLTCQVPFHCASIVPGQYAFISFDASFFKAWFHSHPFSICRLKGDQQLTFYIRANGKETSLLYNTKRLNARISRPLGRPYITIAGSEFGDYKNVVLVAEGMGITPWISVLHYIKDKQHAIRTQNVDLIWSIHTIDTFYAFEKELEEFTEIQNLAIQIFITASEIDPEEDYSIPNNLTFIQFITNRPNYQHLLKKQDNVVLGVCAHEDTTVKLNNLSLFYSWKIKTERFEL